MFLEIKYLIIIIQIMKFLNVYFNGRQQIYHHDKDIKATHNLFLYREISKLKLFQYLQR